MSKKPTIEDWDHHSILYAIRRTRTTISQLSLANELCYGQLRVALYRPAPKYERLIAEHLGTTPQAIWPSRYHTDGTPRSGRGERGMGRYQRKTTGHTNAGRKPYKTKFNGSENQSNVNLTAGK